MESEDRKNIEELLQGSGQRDYAVVLAARAALRTLPNLKSYSIEKTVSDIEAFVALYTFGSAAAIWFPLTFDVGFAYHHESASKIRTRSVKLTKDWLADFQSATIGCIACTNRSSAAAALSYASISVDPSTALHGPEWYA